MEVGNYTVETGTNGSGWSPVSLTTRDYSQQRPVDAARYGEVRPTVIGEWPNSWKKRKIWGAASKLVGHRAAWYIPRITQIKGMRKKVCSASKAKGAPGRDITGVNR